MAFAVATGCCLFAGGASAVNYNLRFSHDLDVWSWDHRAGWNQTIGENLRFEGDGLHTRRLAEAGAFRRRSYVTEGNARLRYPVMRVLTVGADVSTEHSHLRAGNEVSDVIAHRGLFVTQYSPVPALQVNAGVGGAHDERRNVTGTGAVWSAGVRSRPLQAIGFGGPVSLFMSADHSAVESELGDAVTDVGVSGTIAWSRSLRQSFTYSEQRNARNYVSVQEGGPILQRTEHVRHASTEVTARNPLLGGLQLSGDVRWGEVTDDASEDSTSLKYRSDNTTHAYGLGTTWLMPVANPSISWSMEISRSFRDAQPIIGPDSVETPNYLDRRRYDISTGLATTYAIGPRDTISVSGSLRLSRDHTPAEDEVNDRDDYTRAVVASYRHRFTHGTHTELRAERIETHQVWLRAERSANNKWDRALNLWAITRTQIGTVNLRQRAFFKAQLEEFDFDYLTPTNPRSRNARIGRLDFASEIPWERIGSLNMSYALEARTRGTLLPPDKPGERPTIWQLTRNELAQVLSAELIAPLGPRWTLAPEVAVSRQRDYIPTKTRWNLFDLGDRIESQETLYLKAACIYQARESESFSFSAARTYRQRRSTRDTRTSISVTYQRMF